MREEYKIISTRLYPGEHIATLNRDTDGQNVTYSMDIKNYHPVFFGFWERGELHLDHELTVMFISNRVWDANYDWIDKVLKHYGLTHYNKWDLLKAMNCQCGYDDLSFDKEEQLLCTEQDCIADR